MSTPWDETSWLFQQSAWVYSVNNILHPVIGLHISTSVQNALSSIPDVTNTFTSNGHQPSHSLGCTLPGSHSKPILLLRLQTFRWLGKLRQSNIYWVFINATPRSHLRNVTMHHEAATRKTPLQISYRQWMMIGYLLKTSSHASCTSHTITTYGWAYHTYEAQILI